MRVFLTGATGFVGRRALQRLLADGHEIHASFRGVPPPPRDGVTWRHLDDLSNAESLRSLLEGMEAVVHLAALAHLATADAVRLAGEFMRVNRDGTAGLAQAATQAGVRRFVFLSSVKVFGDNSARSAFKEDDARQPADAYGASKAQAEDRLAQIASGGGMEHVVVRPPLVYGPGVRANFLGLMRWIDRGLPVPVATGANRRSLIFVGNLVDALARCVALPAAAGRTYLVSDGEDVSTAELARRVAVALGRPARVVAVPLPLLRLVAGMLGRRSAIDRLAGSLAVDASRIRGELEWAPPCTMMQGLEETAAWYRRGGRDV